MNIINSVLSAIVLLICLTLAFTLLFSEFLQPGITGTKRIALIIILFLYALFKAFRVYTAFKK